jgi:hypothetical protein
MRTLVVSLAGLALALGVVAGIRPPDTEAAPAGAASGLRISQQSCAANGTVSAVLSWSPSGRGQQTVNLARNSNFSPTSTGGPFSAGADSVRLTQLVKGTTYFVRVLTHVGGGVIVSDTLSFQASCSAGAFSPPSGLQVSASQTSAVFTWTAGAQNQFFCLDTARSTHELFTQSGSFSNHGTCGMTATAVGVSGLQCGSTYFARVWGWKVAGGFQGGYTQVVQFNTQACPQIFTPPTSLTVSNITATSARLAWTPGAGNDFFCVDVAKNVNDLIGQFGSFRNYACGTTATSLTVNDLTCGTRYFSRVWAWRPFVAGGYSPIVEFTTAACPVTFSPPTDVEITGIDQTSAVVSWEPGVGNLFSCVDVAETRNDLQTFSGTFRNFGCGTTGTEVELSELDCDTDYFVRVYSWRPDVGAAYSEIVRFETAAC